MKLASFFYLLIVFAGLNGCSKSKPAQRATVDSEHAGVEGRFVPAIPGAKVMLCEIGSYRTSGTNLLAPMHAEYCSLRPALNGTADENGTFAISNIPISAEQTNEYVICYAEPSALDTLNLNLTVIPLEFTGLTKDLQLNATVSNGKMILSTDVDLGQHVLKKGAQLQSGFSQPPNPGDPQTSPGLLPLERGNIVHKNSGLTLPMVNGFFVSVRAEKRNQVSQIEVRLPETGNNR